LSSPDVGSAQEARGPVEVLDQAERRRYEATIDGALAGIATYQLEPGTITFIHTEVDRAFRGSHVGSKLARFALDDARSRDLRVVPLCPFIRSYIKRHPEYEDLVR